MTEGQGYNSRIRRKSNVKKIFLFQVDCLQQLCILGAREELINEQYVTQYSLRHSNQWWRLVSSMYLHRGIMDWIVFTSLQIWVTWCQECSQGWLRMALVYHTAGVGGHLVRSTGHLECSVEPWKVDC